MPRFVRHAAIRRWVGAPLCLLAPAMFLVAAACSSESDGPGVTAGSGGTTTGGSGGSAATGGFGGSATGGSAGAAGTPGPLGFAYEVIDADGVGRTAIGDVDGDDLPDVAVHTWGSNRGQVADGSLAWYRYPQWERSVIKDGDHFFGDSVVIADLDGDGDGDVVAAKGNDNSAQVWRFENPGDGSPWSELHVGTVETSSEVKDIEVHDLDGDQQLDIVVRTKHNVALYFQDAPSSWTERLIPTQEREGMALGDLDGDDDHDIVLNGFFLECPADPRSGTWSEHTIDDQWFTDVTGGWQDHSVMAAVADIDGDTRMDVVLCQSEKTGFAVTWYGTDDPTGGQAAWQPHEIEVVDYCHSLAAADMDLDGDVDIIAGTLKRTTSPRIVVFVNQGAGASFSTLPIDTQSVYKAAIGDIGSDGDIDVTSSLSWEDPPIMLWRNTVY